MLLIKHSFAANFAILVDDSDSDGEIEKQKKEFKSIAVHSREEGRRDVLQ